MPYRPSDKWQYQSSGSQYDRIEPGDFEIVEKQRLPKEATPFLIESALEGFSVTFCHL